MVDHKLVLFVSGDDGEVERASIRRRVNVRYLEFQDRIADGTILLEIEGGVESGK